MMAQNNAQSSILKDQDYLEEFDPQTYLKWYQAPEKDQSLWILNTSIMKFVHKSVGRFSGQRFADIVCGPCVHNVLSASGVFEEIYMMEYTPQCRQYVKQWLNKAPGAHDWSPYTRFVAQLEGIPAEQLESRVRDKVKGVLPCDLKKLDPFDKDWASEHLPLDCILSSYTLSSLCSSHEEFEGCLQRFASYLRPGGGLIMVADLEQDFYCVGEKKFYHLQINEDFLHRALAKAGMTVVDQHVYTYTAPSEERATQGNASQSIFVCAQKKHFPVTEYRAKQLMQGSQ